MSVVHPVKLLRLKSGEDIIGAVELTDPDKAVIHNPAMLMPMSHSPGRQDQIQMGFGPWVPFADEKEFEIPRDWIVFISKPAKDLLNNYNAMFGSGIVVPDISVDTKKILTE